MSEARRPTHYAAAKPRGGVPALPPVAELRPPTDEPTYALAFGSFQLIPSERLLLECGQPVRLGGRAIDLLISLVEQAGEIVANERLRACVWPNTVVEDSSLRVHVAALRKALGDGSNGPRYIANVPGRGYSFVAEVARSERPAASVSARPSSKLPVRLTATFGLQPALQQISHLLARRRLVTLVGPGGVGKTTAALAAAELPGCDSDEVRFVDLEPIVDPRSLPALLAAAIGLSPDAFEHLGVAAQGLRDRRVLLVLDNCEHLIEGIAWHAVQLLKAVPGLRILATSREPLRAEGEAVFGLRPLPVPPADMTPVTASEALRYPAVQLLLDRAGSTAGNIELQDSDANAATELCRRLDGLPLAIELAASRMSFFGLQGLLRQLDDMLRILTCGQRTVQARHRSLRALLDWSFGQLEPAAQVVFRRLAALDGPFSLEVATAVVGDDMLQPGDVLEVIMDLASKSLIMAEIDASSVAYRLLGTTRAYAWEKLTGSGDLAAALERRRALVRNECVS